MSQSSQSTIGVMDFELTAWEGSLQRLWSGPTEEPEIVQIGAVTLNDNASLDEIASLDAMVWPTVNPDLSPYFTNLTGITQDDLVKSAIPFKDALRRLTDLFDKSVKDIYFYGIDDRILRYNCNLNDLEFPFADRNLVNARNLVIEANGTSFSHYSSNQLPEALGLEFIGTPHQALSDCRCLAAALRKLRDTGHFPVHC